MKTHNPDNERTKRRYFAYLKEARRFSEASLDGVAKALNRFEAYTRFKDFQTFHREQAVAFKRYFSQQTSLRTGDRLSKATLYVTLKALRSFFLWLAGQPGYRKRLSYSDADYFNLSDKETRVAKAIREQRVPTLEQIKHVIQQMPLATETDRRNRTLIALTLLTGARDGAIASLKLKHLDLAEGRLIQDAREVNTKFSKTFSTYFFPVGEDVLPVLTAILSDWISYLQKQLLWGPDDPLFPATKVAADSGQQFAVCGLDRRHWRSATPIRKIFKQAFANAGLEYFNPHSFRKTLAQLGERLCKTPEMFKAWSQNLGHEQVMTTLSSYGSVATARQAEIIRELAQPKVSEADVISRMKELLSSGAVGLR